MTDIGILTVGGGITAAKPATTLAQSG